ncbi:membrane dipeptidase [candidate division KSB1 bacterium]|nr:membrane dipeptidase [candidate division KSB1 bacterium]
MKIYTCIFISLIFFSMHGWLPAAAAQEYTLYGTVKDRINAAPLDSVQIAISIPDLNQQHLVSTDAVGYWRCTIQTMAVDEPNPVPTSFALHQNYPNPFNPATRIYFSIDRPGEVVLRVYNTLGQLLDSQRRFLTAGDYTVDWYASGGTGVLFYELEFQQQRQVRKMLQMEGGTGGLGEMSQNADRRQNLQRAAFEHFAATVSATKLGFAPDTTQVTLAPNQQLDFLLDLLHTRSLVIDLHNDVLEKVVGDGYQLGSRHNYNHSDLPRFIEGGVDAQMFVVWVDPYSYPKNAYQQALKFCAAFQNQLALNAKVFAQAQEPDDILQINAQQKFAGVLVVEGGHAIENDLEKLRELYRQGMRYLTITWNNSTEWAISAEDSRSTKQGLSDFGRDVIRTLDSLGVIIDVSHTGIKTIEDILAVTKNPIIASHSGVRALRNHFRNLYDQQIVAIANSGGVIGVVFYPSFLSSGRPTDINTVIAHIDYIVRLVGIDYVALGSDFDGIETTPKGLEDVSRLPRLTMALLKHGYSNQDVKKILGENFMRVFRQVRANRETI